MKNRIYLDNNATTVVSPKVIEAMTAELSCPPSNPSSLHTFGQHARSRLSQARQRVAQFFNVQPSEVIFTSGGTESMNLLLRGIITPDFKGHVISSDIEHSCVYHTLKQLKAQTTFLSSGLWGAPLPEAVEAAIRPDTRLIVLSAANSETGVKLDLTAISDIGLKAHIPLIVDGVGILGKEAFPIPKGVSGIGFSSHKCHGPKGVGCAIVRSNLRLTPELTGGEQESGKRAGTENLPGIIGFAAALDELSQIQLEVTEQIRTLRDQFEQTLLARIPGITIHGQGPRICNTSNISFPKMSGEDLVIALDLAGIAASHGSACSSGSLEPSRVLTNMGVSFEKARTAVRFSLSRYTTSEEILKAIEIIVSTL